MISVGTALWMKFIAFNNRLIILFWNIFRCNNSWQPAYAINIFNTVTLLSTGSCSSYILFTYSNYWNSRTRYFQSPNHPNCYPNNKDCTWLIETTAYNYIYLQINQFNLEYGGGSCPNDYLEIRDGNTPSSPLITKMCGSVGYTYIYSTGRFLLVRFVSNGYFQMPGFRAYCYAVRSSKKYFLLFKVTVKCCC